MIYDKVPGLERRARRPGREAGDRDDPRKSTAFTVAPTKASGRRRAIGRGRDDRRGHRRRWRDALAQALPMNDDLIANSHGLGIALAADSVNQLFAGLWAAGALDKTLPISSVGALGAILDASATTIELHLALPPTVTTGADGLDSRSATCCGTTKDDAGNRSQALALSVKTTLQAGPSQTGKLLLTVGTPELHAQIVGRARPSRGRSPTTKSPAS